MAPSTAAFGAWKSPITTDVLAGQSTTLESVAAKEGTVYVVEGRSTEGKPASSCIVERTLSGNVTRDILPEGYSARCTIHEYGGGAVSIGPDGILVFTDAATKGVYFLEPKSGTVAPLTKPDPQLRYGDFDIHPSTPEWILAVREDHREPRAVENCIVLINSSTKETKVLASGSDFYAFPRFNPAGNQICWLEWNHPDMPWTGTVLYTAAWKLDGSIHGATIVAGQPAVESIRQPRWGLDGTLFFSSDRTGYWQLYQHTLGSEKARAIALKGLEDAEFTGRDQKLGSSTYVPLTSTTLVATYTRNSASGMVLIDLETNSHKELDLGLVTVQEEAVGRVSDTSFVVIGSGATTPKALYHVDINTASPQLLKSSLALEIDPSFYSVSQHISFPRVYGSDRDGLAHALFLLPNNPNFQPRPEDKLPPVILVLHGGPTAHASPGLSLETQYWTSRGYAVAHVNYSGSTGYGRAYRERLNTTWGVNDTADIASCAAYLIEKSLVDPARVGIRGISAGGYAVLQALCQYPDIWAGGVSVCGIGSLKALGEDTHKYESHYLMGLLFREGASEEEKEKIYRDRSPYFHADQITAPVLLLQGSEDNVVPPNQAKDMEKSIVAAGGDVRVVIYEGEGHGFRQAVNVRKAMEEEEAWWQKTLIQ